MQSLRLCIYSHTDSSLSKTVVQIIYTQALTVALLPVLMTNAKLQIIFEKAIGICVKLLTVVPGKGKKQAGAAGKGAGL